MTKTVKAAMRVRATVRMKKTGKVLAKAAAVYLNQNSSSVPARPAAVTSISPASRSCMFFITTLNLVVAKG